MPLPEGMKQYTKGKPIKHHEFDPVREWWNSREENAYAHKVSIEQIKERNYNLDFKNPNGAGAVEQMSSSDLKTKIMETEKTIQSILKEL